MKVNGKTIEESKVVKGLIKHNNCRFYASDRFYNPSNVKLSNLIFNPVLECSNNKFGIFSGK